MTREAVSKRYYVGERAIVVGGGLAGLSAARALSDRVRQVMILDSDELPTVSLHGLACRKVNTLTPYLAAA